MKLKLEASQKQQMSPKLTHSMNILQMSYAELNSMIDESLLDNPFAEVEEILYTMDTASQKDNRFRRSNFQSEREFEIPDNQEVEFLGHIKYQLQGYLKTNTDKKVLEFLIESLDDRGYLVEGTSEIINIFGLSRKEANRYLEILQSVEPKGTGAKNLIECLLLQIDNCKENCLVRRIIKNYLTEVGNHDLTYIAKSENTSIEKVKSSIEIIKSLNPIPSNGFSLRERVAYIIPDAYIKKENGKIIIELNSSFEKKLKISKHNLDTYKHGNFDKVDKEFLSIKLQDFKLLKYCTSRRSITLQKVIESLVKYQSNFLSTGLRRNLKPLRLKDLEEITGLHSSTISRAIRDKYFYCEYGTFPLKTLMPRAYSKKGKLGASKNLVKEEIAEIIRLEDKGNPYSDREIEVILVEEGFSISRRSISKYREELLIPTSNKRKVKT